MINSKIKWCNKKERKEFNQEYTKLINEGFILRLKKRTGKGSDRHISLNPRKVDDIKELLSEAKK